MKICFVPDLHGSDNRYQHLLTLAHSAKPDLLILGGDQVPVHFDVDAVEKQRSWLLTYFADFLECLPDGCQTCWASGNHDLQGALNVISKLSSRLLWPEKDWILLEDGWSIRSLPYGPPSGWLFKDWERRDIDHNQSSDHNKHVYISTETGVSEVDDDDWLKSFPTLATLFANLSRPPDPAKAILVCHYPPYDSKLDQTAFGKPIGSRALRQHLMNTSYALSLHGHVHESPYLTGEWARQIGQTLSINPGQWGPDLHAVLYDTEDIANTLTHTVFGTLSTGTVPRMSAKKMQRQMKKAWRKAGIAPQSLGDRLAEQVGRLVQRLRSGG